MAKLKKIYTVKGNLRLETGLHIGAGSESMHIGGVDSPVVKVRMKGRELPYIPGSSLKGKLRSLLEIKEGLDAPDSSPESIISQMFGCASAKENSLPGALVFRDAFLTETERDRSRKELFEEKSENMIDRTTGRVKGGLRQIERVVPGLSFDVEISIRHFEGVDLEEIKTKLVEALRLLENDYLGGSGTRGYGKVDVSDIIAKIQALGKEE